VRIPTFDQTLFEYCNNPTAYSKSRSCQTKEYKIGICCFSAENAALRRKSKDWLAQNQNNVSEWSDISIRRRLFHATYLSADNCFTELELLNLTLEERLVDCDMFLISSLIYCNFIFIHSNKYFLAEIP
jgi:hypothetical protein